jgi:hypothetical protein
VILECGDMSPLLKVRTNRALQGALPKNSSLGKNFVDELAARASALAV